MNKKLLIGIFTLILIFTISFITAAVSEKQAPELQKAVEEGELEPLEERLPENPLVIEPHSETGKYGGTWNRLSTSEEWLFFQNALDGNKFTRFTDQEGLDPVPNLIEDWETNDDMTSFTFYFREGLKWSDGNDLTVDDFLFFWEDMALNEDHSMGAPGWSIIQEEYMEVNKIDDYTMEFNFEAPNIYLIDQLSMWADLSWANYIFPKHYLKQFHPDYTDEYSNFETFEEKQHWSLNSDIPVLHAWKPVESKSGEYIIFERNPYYWAVDSEGNQLPYMDKVRIDYVNDIEVFKMKAASGDVDMQIKPRIFMIEDLSYLKQNEEDNNFETLMWSGGSGTGPLYLPNHNHQDPDKRELYRNSDFLTALSHAINRDRIIRMVYYDMGEPTTGTYSKTTPEQGELYEKWKNLAVEFDQEKSKELLDELGVVDQNDDGWRELPNGEELNLRIDTEAGVENAYLSTTELVKEDWREVGLRTTVNTMDPAHFEVQWNKGELDIRNSWEASDGSSIVGQPEWMVPVEAARWAPLYGQWFSIRKQDTVDEQKDIDPYEREPAHKEPEEDSSVYKLHQLYLEARETIDEEKRQKLVNEMIKIHMNEGPFIIGTVADYPSIGVVSNNMNNVPEDLNATWVLDWHLGVPAMLNPDQYYFEN